MDFWRDETGEETYFVCYYIDGNTKALWSSNRCYKGKVTMLGRVMNCLENVFIHDGKGHPLYFQTFHGHADLGKHALNMLTKLTELFDDPSAHVHVKRIRGKDKVYRIDTELDQIMTCFKMSFVNLCSLFLTKCMNHEKFELLTLFESIFQLGGDSFVSDGKKTIGLAMNPKEPKLMDKLEKGLRVLNTMDVHDLDGRSIKFTV